MSYLHLWNPFLFFSLCLAATAGEQQPCLIPLPAKVEVRACEFRLDSATAISAPEEFRSLAELCAAQLRGPAGFALPVRDSGSIVFEKDASLSRLTDEGYVLDVTPERVRIRAAHRRGLFYGFQTFRQLLPDKAFAPAPVAGDARPWTARCVHIEDRPRFKWRAMMLDSARTFQDVAYIRRYIDWLSVHKINVFHWHLTDDEGWRIEIKGLPELTKAGAWNGPKQPLELPGYRSKWFPADDRHGGFYTQDELRGIVAYAAERGVDILPEIDVPGHSRAVAVAYPEILCKGKTDSVSAQGFKNNVWCASRPENEAMLATLFTEVASIFPFKYIHVGGDEVNGAHWLNCPSCNALAKREGLPNGAHLQPLVTKRLEALCAKLDRKLVGWNEILGAGISTNTCIMSWTGIEPGFAAAAKGHPVVMAPGKFCYLDMYQGPDERGHWWAGMGTLERCYSFNPLLNAALTPAQLGNILGVEATLFTEFCLPHAGVRQSMGLTDEDLYRKHGNSYPAPERFMDYQTYPRLAALAEVGWTPQALRSFPDFANRLGQGHLARLGRLGIRYRIPTPSAQHEEGMVTIRTPWEGAEVRYTTDGSAPGVGAAKYTAPFAMREASAVRAVTVMPDGGLSQPAAGAERASAAEWSPGTFCTQTKRARFDVRHAVNGPGNWGVELRHLRGSSQLQVKAVRLFSDNTQVAEDIHDCTLNALRADGGGANYYRLQPRALSVGSVVTLEIEAVAQEGMDCAGFALVRRSPWHEPVVTVTADVPANGEHVLGFAGDWNRKTLFWTSRGIKAGETVTWTFTEAVPSADVLLPTGKLQYREQDLLESGTLLVSYDGAAFEPVSSFSNGIAKVFIDKPFKALRLRADGDARNRTLAVQDPQILARGLTPACKVTSTMNAHAENVAGRAADWKRDTWFLSNRSPRKDDLFTWTFAAPVACSTIELLTGELGRPDHCRLEAGVLEVSYNGTDWKKIGSNCNGQLAGAVYAPVRALRLRITADHPNTWIYIHDPVLNPGEQKYGAFDPIPSVIPSPRSTILREGSLALGRRIVHNSEALQPLATVLADEVMRMTGLRLDVRSGEPEGGDILLKIDPSLKQAGAYVLDVADKVTVSGGDYKAVADGTVSLLQMLSPEYDTRVLIPRLRIEDAPFAAYRGLLVDVARSWHSLEILKRLVVLCRWYKIQYLQIHFSDHQSFAFPSTAFPALATPNRHYTVAELKELEAFAHERGVTIVPELDVPGHSGTAVRAMPELFATTAKHPRVICVGREEVYRALDVLIGEMLDIFRTTEYFHIGADEVEHNAWSKCEDCRRYMAKHQIPDVDELYRHFIVRMNEIVKKHERKTLVWEGFKKEGKTEIPRDITVMVFESMYNIAPDLIAQGYPVINTAWNPLYVVGNLNCSPEHIYGWNMYRWEHFSPKSLAFKTPIEVSPTNLVLGAQMCAWEQPQHIEIASLRKRLAAMSERIWNPDAIRDYKSFERRLSHIDNALERVLW